MNNSSRSILHYALAFEAVWAIAIATHFYTRDTNLMLIVGGVGSVIIIFGHAGVKLVQFFIAVVTMLLRPALSTIRRLATLLFPFLRFSFRSTPKVAVHTPSHHEKILLQDGATYRIDFDVTDNQKWQGSISKYSALEEALRREVEILRTLCDFDTYDTVIFFFLSCLFSNEILINMSNASAHHKIRHNIEEQFGIKLIGLHFMSRKETDGVSEKPPTLGNAHESLWRPEMAGV